MNNLKLENPPVHEEKKKKIKEMSLDDLAELSRQEVDDMDWTSFLGVLGRLEDAGFDSEDGRPLEKFNNFWARADRERDNS